VVKRWHDAGDFSLYSAFDKFSTLLAAIGRVQFSPREDDTGIPESENGVPDRWMRRDGGSGCYGAVARRRIHNTTRKERCGPYGTNWRERLVPTAS
jgi:hypothetical protein